MYPNQPQPTPQAPPPNPGVDYLNQIAPQSPQRKFFKGPMRFVLIGAALVLIVSVIAIIINVINQNQRVPMEHLAARLSSSEKIVSDAQDNLKNSELRSLNSNLKIYLTNTTRDMVTPFSNVGIDVAKLDKKVTAAESGSDVSARLEDARLNAIFDRTYAREIAYRLETTMALMRQVYSTTRSPSLKAFLENAYNNLQPTQKAFADFNADNG